MKATLTIEVPDDFKKGECIKCPLVTGCSIPNYLRCPVRKVFIPVNTDYVCVDNCPLEIQENLHTKGPAVNFVRLRCKDYRRNKDE